jgi:hypothetical protein
MLLGIKPRTIACETESVPLHHSGRLKLCESFLITQHEVRCIGNDTDKVKIRNVTKLNLWQMKIEIFCDKS